LLLLYARRRPGIVSGGDYTAALPSIEKVKAQLKGTDPIDTVARQVAVLT
jgi:hypothetical protein